MGTRVGGATEKESDFSSPFAMDAPAAASTAPGGCALLLMAARRRGRDL